jgi:hypothetical protein
VRIKGGSDSEAEFALPFQLLMEIVHRIVQPDAAVLQEPV